MECCQAQEWESVYRANEPRANFLGCLMSAAGAPRALTAVYLGLAPVPQAGEPVPDVLVAVSPAFGQVNHPAAQDEVLYLVLGHGDQAGCIRAGRAREEDAGGMAAWLQQGHCGGQSRQGSWDQTQCKWVALRSTPRLHSPWKATTLAETLASSSRTPGRMG